MALPTRATNSWRSGIDTPGRLFANDRSDYELYEEDDEFVLSVELPGFEPEEMDVVWDEGVLNVSAEHEDADRGRRRTYHRRFRFPKAIEDEEIAASYTNGVLEVRLPLENGVLTGREIEIEA